MRILFILSVTVFSLVFSFSCGQGESGPKFGTGTLKQPVQNLYPPPLNPLFVDLPLLMWSSFEYRMINKVSRSTGFTGGGKSQHCVLQESEGSQLQIGTKVEVLDEAKCLYVLLNSNDGKPRPYTITIMQIRLIETGEEGWTWSKAIEFDKK